MIKIIDWYIFKNFLTNLLRCGIFITGIVNIYDLLTNLDSFINLSGSRPVIATLGEYYFYKTFLFLDNNILPILSLISAFWVIASMSRNSETIALLAMGVPFRRIIIPLLLAAGLLNGVMFWGREIFIPKRITRIVLTPDELSHPTPSNSVFPLVDQVEGIKISGRELDANEGKIILPKIELPPGLLPSHLRLGNELQAICGTWSPDDPNFDHASGYYLEGVTKLKEILSLPSIRPASGNQETASSSDSSDEGEMTEKASTLIAEQKPIIYTPADYPILKNDECFVATQIMPELLAVGEKEWKIYASTLSLIRAARNPSLPIRGKKQELQTRVHTRIHRLLSDILPLLLGLPFIFFFDRKNMIWGVLLGLAFALLYFGLIFEGFYLGNKYSLPVLGAWLPIILFAPIATNLMADLWKR